MEFGVRELNESPPGAENVGGWCGKGKRETGAEADNDHLTALPAGRSRRASKKLLSILIFIRSPCRLCFSHIHGSHIRMYSARSVG